jgi:hypothetical protein
MDKPISAVSQLIKTNKLLLLAVTMESLYEPIMAILLWFGSFAEP